MAQGIDPRSDRAAYRQIADRLRQAMHSGALEPGAQIPSERLLMEEYGAARGTVRQAIAVLRSEGLVTVEHGRGAFVRQQPPIRRLAHDRFARRHRKAGKAAFLAESEAEGRRPEVEVVQVGSEPSDAIVADRLRLATGEPVLVRRRRYLSDGVPVELATSYLPFELVEGTAICERNPGPGGIYARLEELGHELASFTEEVSARMPMPDEVRSLELAPGIPVFCLVRTAFDTDDRPVEICDTVMAADRFVLSYDLPAR